MKRKPAAQAPTVNECPQCTTPHRCGRQDSLGARGPRCVGLADGLDDCDCLNDCGDDPWLAKGKARPCARRQQEEAAATFRVTAGPAEYASWFPVNANGVRVDAAPEPDEDEQWAIDRGADFLEHYAQYIHRVKPEDIEAHPYLPELEAVAVHLRALSRRRTAGVQGEAPTSASTPDWARNGMRAAMVKVSKALGHPNQIEAGQTQCVEAALIELAAERIAGVAATPEGWKLVPVTPTPQMRDAAVQAICYGPEGGFTRIAGPDKAWKAMLDAAPAAGVTTSTEPQRCGGCGHVLLACICHLPHGVSASDGQTFHQQSPRVAQKKHK